MSFLDDITKVDLSPFILTQEDIERSLVDIRTDVIELAARKVAELNEHNSEVAVILELTRRCTELEAKLTEIESQEPVARITEQDAREILSAFEGWDKSQFMQGTYDGWFKAEGRTLLNKLNADREQVPAADGESHAWNDQDKCEKCGDRDWYAEATCAGRPAVAVPDLPSVKGVSVDAASPNRTGVIVFFERELTSDEFRKLHDLLSAAPSHSQQRCNIGNAESHDKELQVTIEHNGKIFSVDESISEFVQLLNSVGLETVASCSGHGQQSEEVRVSALAEALEEARLTLQVMQGKGSSAELTIAIVDRALAAYRKGE